MKNVLNNAVSLIVVMIVLLLIIPLSPFFLDVMIILNIAISLIILLVSMNIKEALEFSIFPSLLLITTLYRIGINISSTRSILSNSGTAGQVIQSMGDFVLQGNVVVGVIIFLIIVLVQFLVITKGAERVAEVAARFTLDAMPGKQMAIDADLGSGLITEEEAKARRYKIQKEADFYGSMDGATKIVKGGTGSGDVNERECVTIYQGMKDGGYVITNEAWIAAYDQMYQEARLCWKEAILRKIEENPEKSLDFFTAYSTTPFYLPAGPGIGEVKGETAIYVLSRIAGENADRICREGDYLLSEEEEKLLNAVCTSYEKVIVVINTGGLVDLSFMEQHENIYGLIQLVQPGMEGGHGFCDIVSGRKRFSICQI